MVVYFANRKSCMCGEHFRCGAIIEIESVNCMLSCDQEIRDPEWG